MKHTPGPWHYKKEVMKRFDSQTGEARENIFHNIESEVGEHIADRKVASTFDCFRPFEQREANAYLIAAAPEMLSSLESLVNRLSHSHDDSDEELQTAKLIIKKAKGE